MCKVPNYSLVRNIYLGGGEVVVAVVKDEVVEEAI